MQTAQEQLDEWQKFIARFPTKQDYELFREENGRLFREERERLRRQDERHREQRRARARRDMWGRTLTRFFVEGSPPDEVFPIQRLHQTGWHIEGVRRRLV